MLERVVCEDIIGTEILDAIRYVQVTDFDSHYIDEKLAQSEEELPLIVKELEETPFIFDYEGKHDIWESYFGTKTAAYYDGGSEEGSMRYEDVINERIQNFKIEDGQKVVYQEKLKHRYQLRESLKVEGLDYEDDQLKKAYRELLDQGPLADVISFMNYDMQ